MVYIIKPILKLISSRKLKSLQYENGLFAASRKDVGTGYNAAWIRDNIYEALGLEIRDPNSVKKTYHALFDIFKKHETKIDHAIKSKPQFSFDYIHPRYNPENMSEFSEPWGNKQNDAIGAFLFKVGDLYKRGIVVFRDNHDLRILQKLVYYLGSIEYWKDPDNGIWEENEEVHASSVGACVAGLREVSDIVFVPEEMIRRGQETLNKLLPWESQTKRVDLALLSLIYPFKVVTPSQRMEIIWNVENELVREKGVIRYPGDKYYSNGKEAEWCFGFPWLAKIYKDLGNMERYDYYMRKTHAAMNSKLELPELYYASTNNHNENSPLGWALAMYLVAVS